MAQASHVLVALGSFARCRDSTAASFPWPRKHLQTRGDHVFAPYVVVNHSMDLSEKSFQYVRVVEKGLGGSFEG